MSPAEIASLIGMLTAFVGAMGVVWRAASMMTAHGLRIDALERGHGALLPAIDELRRAIVKLDKHLAVSNARQSAGQFDQGTTDPPEGYRR